MLSIGYVTFMLWLGYPVRRSEGMAVHTLATRLLDEPAFEQSLLLEKATVGDWNWVAIWATPEGMLEAAMARAMM